MVKKMLIDATHAEETRVVVVDGNKVEEFDFETVNKRQLAGNIYLAKVTRVEPSLQAAFVDYGGNRHGFLAFAEIHPDYYQIPVADRKALLEEERALARAEEEEEAGRNRRRGPRNAVRAEAAASADAVQTAEIGTMDVVDLGEETGADALYAAASGDRGGPAEDDLTFRPARGSRSRDDGDEDEDGGTKTYRSVDHATELDDGIESVAEEDVAEEIRQPRKPRHRKYKIQEVIKVRQIMLVQVVKEERGNKGAALTTYLSLAGRYCVLMPNTARGGGISRKITQAADRKKLKEIAQEIEVPEGAGLIIRTAGAKRTKPEIRRDYEYLMRLWEQVRELTLKSIAPAPIYEEGNLIKRSIRDLYNREIEEVLVEGAEGYRVAKDFMKMIMPSHAKVVQPYAEAMPLFARYQVESYLGGMFNPTVQLKSGGYIVIGVTEALVAIDVNSGRATREGSIEQTALNTNLEAAEEIARQLRLRDLAGLIVIDFIDMEERKNNAAVEKKLKDKLKTDRARIQVGRISGFGLLEMSRQRLRPGMLESTTQPCAHCHGTGLIRSDDSMALQVLRQLEEEGTRRRSKEVLLRAPVAVVNYLMNQKREHIALIEARYDMAVRIEADPSLISPDYSIEKFKTATRVISPAMASVISAESTIMPDLEEEEPFPTGDGEDAAEDDSAEEEGEESSLEARGASRAEAAAGEGTPGKKKRRRRRRRRAGTTGAEGASVDTAQDHGGGSDNDGAEDVAEVTPEMPVKKAGRTRTRSRKTAPAESPVAAAVAEALPDVGTGPVAGPPAAEARPDAGAGAEAPAKKPARSRRTAKGAEPAERPAAQAEPVAQAEAVSGAAPETPVKRSRPRARAALAEAAAPVVAEPPAAEVAAPGTDVAAPAPPAPQTWVAAPEPVVEGAPPEDDGKPKKRGWWSLGR
ncbi:MAG: Rne/Rng family ribonuclease [Rhodobacter sp.]|nr:Rne/Rng family ribonuclease [Rhodobacter sp.]MCA3519549.1 Rne/Rng family ribonuclease [Rhodobacter sp.]MCA3522883.1 Rne/Rng family ribonuclease [Rhodobacter sp.]MCA3528499.1 Rne/Rng family ribonuclease [Rhodobacter sp.]MCA3532988.1 Rne/Rng family ribonuclease [Rhodobacter sp.]